MIAKKLTGVEEEIEQREREFREWLAKFAACTIILTTAIVLAVAHIMGVDPASRIFIYRLAGFTVVFSLAAYFFPWHRYNSNYFLAPVIIVVAILMALIHHTGGENSPFTPFFFLVAIACGAYFRKPALVFAILVICYGFLNPYLVKEKLSAIGLGHLLITIPLFIAMAVISYSVANRLKKQRREIEEEEEELWKEEEELHEKEKVLAAARMKVEKFDNLNQSIQELSNDVETILNETGEGDPKYAVLKRIADRINTLSTLVDQLKRP